MGRGKLYLIPVPIHAEADFSPGLIPHYLVDIVNKLNVFARLVSKVFKRSK